MEIGPNYHIGHLVLDYMKRHRQIVGQIDAATGEEQTYGATLSRSIELARSLREMGFKPGDSVAIGGRNHLDIHIPFYASIFNGLPIVGVDPYFKYDEIYKLFDLSKPKIAFCQNEYKETYAKAASDLGLQMKIVSFDGDSSISDVIKTYDTKEPEQDFKPQEIDIENICAFLISTSGTSGKVKLAIIKHEPFMIKLLRMFKQSVANKKTHKRTLNLSPVQWISNYFICMFAPVMGDTKIQTSKPDDLDHIIEIINKYRPQTSLMSPSLMSMLLSRKEEVDLTSFETISLAGSKVYPDKLEQFRKLLSKDALILDNYGQTEMLGPILIASPFSPAGSCGKCLPGYSIKLVDPDTGIEIKEPNVTGELWSKSLLRFAGYYNDPEENRLSFSEDGYFKTGDLLYRDDDDNYYFVDRLKTLIKYRNSHVIASEIEEVIGTHPSVKEVSVIGIKHPEDGQRPVACIVKKKDSHVTAQEIKDLVTSKLSKNKALHGGVVFLDRIPMTSTGKLARGKLQEIVLNFTTE
ncbi:unnamed protein product, partial [Brenthis ino]